MAPSDSSKRASSFFDGEAMKYFQNLKMPAMDTEAWTDIQRKNMDALVKAQQALIEAMTAISHAQTQYLQTSLDTVARYAQTIDLQPHKAQDNLTAHTKATQDSVDRLIKHGQNLAQLWAHSNEKIAQTMTDRMTECMRDAQNLTNKPTTN